VYIDNSLPVKLEKIMRSRFQNTASALCYSIIEQRCESASSALTFHHNKVVCFVLQQHSRMSDFLQLPIVVLTLIFDLWGIVQGGTLFHRLPPSVRWLQIESWRRSPIGACRDLIRFYESLTIFSYYANTTTNLVGK
jgi:hypothetical protein